MSDLSSEIQSIGFYKPPMGDWSKILADKWLRDHSYKPIKEAHETANMIHYRMTEPSPEVYSKFISKTIGTGKRKILMTVGVGKKCKTGSGGCCRCIHKAEFSGGSSEFAQESGFLTSFPLRKEGSILKSVIPDNEYHREPDKGGQSKDLSSTIVKENEEKVLTNSLIPNFGPETMIGAMLKPVKEGGIGFPFPVSMSTFSPSAYR